MHYANLRNGVMGGRAISVAAPSNSVLPSIAGAAIEGQILTVSTGTWTGSPTYAYQWKRGGAPIGGATASTYLLVADDVGLTITVTVTATNAGGSASVTSDPTGTVAATPVYALPTRITSGDAAPEYTESGSWSGGAGDRFTNSNGSASFKFGGLIAATTYRLAQTWWRIFGGTPAWTVYDSDGTTVLGTGTVSQATAHETQGSAVGYFGDQYTVLGSFAPSGTSLTVKLTGTNSDFTSAAGALLEPATNASTCGSYGTNGVVGAFGTPPTIDITNQKAYYDSQLDFRITGRYLTLNGNVGSILVDGAAGPTPTTNTNTSGFASYRYDLGTDAVHDVSVVFGSYFAFGSAIQVEGVVPAIGYATGFAATNYNIHSTATGFQTDGSLDYQTILSRDAYASPLGTGTTQSNGSVRFRASCTTIRAFVYAFGKYRVLADGSDAATTTVGPTGGWQWVTLASGLSATEREYRISGSSLIIAAVMTLGGAVVTASTPTQSELVAVYGDSRIESLNFTESDYADTLCYLIQKRLGWATVNLGVAGCAVKTYGPGQTRPMDANTSQVTGILRAPTRVWITGGINDLSLGHGASGGGEAALIAAYQGMVADIVAGLPSASVYCTTEPACNSGPGGFVIDSDRTTFNADLPAAVAAGGSLCHLVDMDAVITPFPSADFGDSVHWTTAGNIKYVDTMGAATYP